MREEPSSDCSRKVTVDRKIIPFKHITNHASGDYPVLRRIHARSPYLRSSLVRSYDRSRTSFAYQGDFACDRFGVVCIQRADQSSGVLERSDGLQWLPI